MTKGGETENEFRHNESATNPIKIVTPEGVTNNCIRGLPEVLKNVTPFHKPEMEKTNFAVVGIDTEFQKYTFLSRNKETKENLFLICTQLSFVLPNDERYHVFVVNYSFATINISSYLKPILRYFYENNILFTSFDPLKSKSKKLKNQNVIPCNLYLVFHNSRCDLSFFRDLISVKNQKKFIEIGSSLITSKPLKMKCCYARRVGRLGYNFSVDINIRDNMLYLVDSKSLDSYSDQTCYGKITDNNFDKSDMISHFLTDTDDFVRYALSDSATTVDFPIKLFDRLDPPLTIGSEASYEYLDKFCEEFNITTKEEFYFKYAGLVPKFDRNRRKKEFVPFSTKLEEINNMFSKSYYGGINQCYTRGFEPGLSYDYDLLSAYPSNMYMIPMIDYKEEHSKFKIIRDCSIEEAKQYTTKFVNLNCAIVDYDLNENKTDYDSIKYVGLFVQKSMGSLTTVMRGTDVYVSGPALYIGLKLGVITKIHKLVYVPTIPNVFPFKKYCQYWIDERAKYKKGTPANTRCKLMANSLYGKTGQSVTDAKGTKYINGEKYKTPIPKSPVTNPIYASTITDLCRVVLMLSMCNVRDQGYRAFSVTTDGFISNYPRELINNILDVNPLTKGIHKLLTDTRNAITHNTNSDYFEVKHINENGFFNLGTRANFGVDDTGVLARGGCNFKKDRSIIHDIIINNFVLKEKTTKATSFYDIIHRRKVYDIYELDKYSRFEYDYKRMPDLETLKIQDISDVVIVHDGVEYTFEKGTKIVYYDTKLYETIEEFEDYKNTVKQYIDNNNAIVSDDFVKINHFVKTKNCRIKTLNKNIVLKSIFMLLDDKYKSDKDYSEIKNFNSSQIVLMVEMLFDGVSINRASYRQSLSRFKRCKSNYDFILDEECVVCIEKIIGYLQNIGVNSKGIYN